MMVNNEPNKETLMPYMDTYDWFQLEREREEGRSAKTKSKVLDDEKPETAIAQKPSSHPPAHTGQGLQTPIK
jgi:hypothetical protein